VDAARELLTRGITPTVEEVAVAAAVSRPTAYRYFPNQRELLGASHPELTMKSLLPDSPPSDPLKRLDLASKELVGLLLQHELALRAMLRISLEGERGENKSLALRTGRRIDWVKDALSPLKARLAPKRYRKLVLSVSATLGIEPLVWLIDIAGVDREEAAQILRDAARDLLRAAL
jgi:hypothetical protein